jgi:uncharacterized protein (DUF1501 family)
LISLLTERLGVDSRLRVWPARRRERQSRDGSGQRALVFIIGGAIRRGLIGTTPSLTDLEEGDMKTHTDFQRDYAAALNE